MPDNATVPGDHETEMVPGDPAFVRANKSPESNDEAERDEEGEPPVSGDRVIDAEKNSRRQRKLTAVLRHEADELRHHEGDEEGNERDARQREEGRVNKCLLDAVAQIFRLHQMFDQASEDIRQRAAGFTGGDEIHVDGRKDAGEIAKRL